MFAAENFFTIGEFVFFANVSGNQLPDKIGGIFKWF